MLDKVERNRCSRNRPPDFARSNIRIRHIARERIAARAVGAVNAAARSLSRPVRNHPGAIRFEMDIPGISFAVRQTPGADNSAVDRAGIGGCGTGAVLKRLIDKIIVIAAFATSQDKSQNAETLHDKRHQTKWTFFHENG